MRDTVTLHGCDAISYAAAHNMTLKKAADPVENAREGVSLQEAREIARQDASLLSLEIPWRTVRQHIEALREQAVATGDDDCGEQCCDALEGDHDAICRCMAARR